MKTYSAVLCTILLSNDCSSVLDIEETDLVPSSLQIKEMFSDNAEMIHTCSHFFIKTNKRCFGETGLENKMRIFYILYLFYRNIIFHLSYCMGLLEVAPPISFLMRCDLSFTTSLSYKSTEIH